MIFFRVANFYLNYLSKRWLIACFITGIVLFLVILAGEFYIATERGVPFDLQTVFVYGLVPALLIPFMIYLVFLSFSSLTLVLQFRQSVFAGLTGENQFLFKQLMPDIKVQQGEQSGYEQKLARVKVRDRFPYTAHVIITDKGIYIHGGLMRVNKLFKGLMASSQAENGLMHFSFDDIESVEHTPGTKRRTYKVLLKNQRWFEIVLPKKDDAAEVDGDVFSEITSLFREKAVAGKSDW